MKISQKLFLLLLVGAMLPVAIITLVFYQHTTAALREQIKNQLNSITERQAGHIQLANERNMEVIGVFDAKLQLKLVMDNGRRMTVTGWKTALKENEHHV